MALKVGNTTIKKVNVVKDGKTTALKKLYVGDVLVWTAEYDVLAEMTGKWKYIDATYYTTNASIASQTSSKLTLTCSGKAGWGAGCINAYIGPIDVTNHDLLTINCSSITSSTDIFGGNVVARFGLRNTIPTQDKINEEVADGTLGDYGSFGTTGNNNAAFLYLISGTPVSITGTGSFTLDCSDIDGDKYILVQLSSEYDGSQDGPSASLTINSIKFDASDSTGSSGSGSSSGSGDNTGSGSTGDSGSGSTSQTVTLKNLVGTYTSDEKTYNGDRSNPTAFDAGVALRKAVCSYSKLIAGHRYYVRWKGITYGTINTTDTSQSGLIYTNNNRDEANPYISTGAAFNTYTHRVVVPTSDNTLMAGIQVHGHCASGESGYIMAQVDMLVDITELEEAAGSFGTGMTSAADAFWEHIGSKSFYGSKKINTSR